MFLQLFIVALLGFGIVECKSNCGPCCLLGKDDFKPTWFLRDSKLKDLNPQQRFQRARQNMGAGDRRELYEVTKQCVGTVNNIVREVYKFNIRSRETKCLNLLRSVRQHLQTHYHIEKGLSTMEEARHCFQELYYALGEFIKKRVQKAILGSGSINTCGNDTNSYCVCYPQTTTEKPTTASTTSTTRATTEPTDIITIPTVPMSQKSKEHAEVKFAKVKCEKENKTEIPEDICKSKLSKRLILLTHDDHPVVCNKFYGTGGFKEFPRFMYFGGMEGALDLQVELYQKNFKFSCPPDHPNYVALIASHGNDSYLYWLAVHVSACNVLTSKHRRFIELPEVKYHLPEEEKYRGKCRFLLYRETENTTFTRSDKVERKGFDLETFVNRYSLCGPVAANEFYVVSSKDVEPSQAAIEKYNVTGITDGTTSSPDQTSTETKTSSPDQTSTETKTSSPDQTSTGTKTTSTQNKPTTTSSP